MSTIQKEVNIKNRKASYNYEFIETMTCGIQLTGTEIKSIRQGKVSLAEAYCFINNQELFVKGMNIAVYDQGTHYNHEPTRVRKLLAKKREIEKFQEKLKDQSMTIIAVNMFISQRGWAKLHIAIARGKKTHDKRESLKKKDAQRSLQRQNY
jgi:SsrA-binding protein